MQRELYYFEIVYNCYSEHDHRNISVGPDRDSLGLVEIIDHGDPRQKQESAYITASPAHARLIAKALLAAADDIERGETGNTDKEAHVQTK